MLGLVGIAVVVVLATIGGDGGQSSKQPGASSSGISATVSTAASSPGSTSENTSTTPPSQDVKPCRPGDLTVSLEDPDTPSGAGGTDVEVLRFTNTSSSTCTLTGTPEVVVKAGHTTLATAEPAQFDEPGPGQGAAGPLPPGGHVVVGSQFSFNCPGGSADTHTGRTFQIHWQSGTATVQLPDAAPISFDCGFSVTPFEKPKPAF